MCLGIPGKVISLVEGYGGGQLVLADVAGESRRVNIGMLPEETFAPGDWVIIHMGFVVEKTDERGGAEAALTGLRLMGSGIDEAPRDGTTDGRCCGMGVVRPLRFPTQRAGLLRASGCVGSPVRPLTCRRRRTCPGFRRRLGIPRRNRGSGRYRRSAQHRGGAQLLGGRTAARRSEFRHPHREAAHPFRQPAHRHTRQRRLPRPGPSQFFHVLVVYPWIRFLSGDPTTPLRILQACRIRWGGTVDWVDDEHLGFLSQPLQFDGYRLFLGAEVLETARWRRDGITLAPRPESGDRIAAHWDWTCGRLSEQEVTALAAATASTLELVNSVRR